MAGSLHKGWKGKLQWDMSQALDENELAVKDAYMLYKTESGMKVTIGNTVVPFSREQLSSSKNNSLLKGLLQEIIIMVCLKTSQVCI